MPIPLPNLDDRSYEDLLAEMRALIPVYTDQWTDHNPSDPGITLLELFAWLADAMIYRLNRITPASEMRFLELLDPAVKKILTDDKLSAKVRLARGNEHFSENWRKKYRAVTPGDFEAIVLAENKKGIARVLCLPGQDLESEPERERAGHVSVVILPKPEQEQADQEDVFVLPVQEKVDGILKRITSLLRERCLLGTKIHVVSPRFVYVGVKVTVFARLRASQTEVENKVKEALQRNFSPWPADPPPMLQPDGAGWPFGRAVHGSEVYQVIEASEGVDYVEDLSLWRHTDTPANDQDTGDEIYLRDWELVSLRPEDIQITMRPFQRSAITGRS